MGRSRQEADVLQPQEPKGFQDLELLDIVGEVATRQSLVDMLEAGQGTELLNPGLHIVACSFFTLADGVQIDLVDHILICGDRFGWDI